MDRTTTLRRRIAGAWARIAERPAQSLLIAIGLLMVVGAFVQSARRDDFAKWTVVAGSALLVVGAVAHRIRELGVGSNKVVLEPDTGTASLTAQATEERRRRPAVRVDEDETIDSARLVAAERALEALLSPPAGSLLDGCAFHLYVYDSYVRQLLPVFEQGPGPPPDGWEVGTGVVGASFARRQYVSARAPETWDDTFAVPEDRRDRYVDRLMAVAAVPVFNAAHAPIGVVSASERTTSDRLRSPAAEEELTTAARAIARVLVDLLGWFPDRYVDVTQEVPR